MSAPATRGTHGSTATGPRRRIDLSRGDLIAGISVALVLIPQSLAYAELAGLPPYLGLYAAALPPLAAAFFASSRYLQTGPVAMTSLLTLGALTAMAAPESPRYIELAALLAIVVGVARVLLGLLRAGVVAYFMSQPILLGFTAAAAILITASQLPTALGLTPPEGGILWRAWWSLTHVGEWDPTAVVLAATTVALVVGGRMLHRLFPGVLVAVVLGVVYGEVAEYSGRTVGEVPAGLPPFSLDLPWGDLGLLLIPGLVIALVGFAEPASISRMFAAQDRERWSANRELISQGVANLAAGVSGGFPVGGSFSRSSIDRLAGGTSRWAGAVTGIAVLAFLPVAGVLSPLPQAILGAIVIAAVYRLIQITGVARIVRYSRPQALVAWTTFGATLALAPRIERGVLIGIGLGVAVHLWRELHITVLADYADGTLRMRPHGVLYFASATSLDETLLDQLALHPEATRLVLDLGQLGRIDYTGALSLKAVAEEAAAAGLAVEVVSVPPQARGLLTRVWEAGPSLPDETQ